MEELEELALEMQFIIRPYAENFLRVMSQKFELIVFTAGEQDVSVNKKIHLITGQPSSKR